jgi:hypothetical protein
MSVPSLRALLTNGCNHAGAPEPPSIITSSITFLLMAPDRDWETF